MHTFEVKEVEDFFIVSGNESDNESALIKRNEELEEMLKKVYNNMDDDNGWQEEQKNEITELLNKK